VVSPAAATGSVAVSGWSRLARYGRVERRDGISEHRRAGSGNHSITAAYSGDGNYSTSTSAALPQVVKGKTTTTVTSNPASRLRAGGELTATVAPSAATGSVQFFDGGRLSGFGESEPWLRRC